MLLQTFNRLAKQFSRSFRTGKYGLFCFMMVSGCAHSGSRDGSSAAKWMEEPISAHKKDGRTLEFPQLGVEFTLPDTLYVFRECVEASHVKSSGQDWIPIVRCNSVNDDKDGSEPISLTFYVTKKTRPLDERAVSWFENSYRQTGFYVDQISYNEDYQNKAGIFAKLHKLDQTTDNPTRVIMQFMFPKNDVVFVARTEYPYGDTRSIAPDWRYILWNFNERADQVSSNK